MCSAFMNIIFNFYLISTFILILIIIFCIAHTTRTPHGHKYIMYINTQYEDTANIIITVKNVIFILHF